MRSKPSISIVGSGNVGYHLYRALARAGFVIRQVDSRKIPARENLQSPDSDVWLICVSDDAVKEVAAKITTPEGCVLHTSGCTDIRVLERFKERAGVLYPLQTFSRQVDMRYDDIPFLLEAKGDHTMEMLKLIAGEISGKYQEADSNTRMKIHIAAVFACNFSNHMAAIAEKILTEEGRDLHLLYPLIEKTFEKISGNSPSSVQTGPAIRGDLSILTRHMESLKSDSRTARLYNEISNHIKEYHKTLADNE